MKPKSLLAVPVLAGLFLAACAAVFGLACFIGWVATRFLPFDQFQATLIGLGAVAIVVFVAGQVFKAMALMPPTYSYPGVVDDEDDEHDESDDEDPAVSPRPPRKWAHTRRRR